jgi:predicted AlkP superfamily phosphohydrolase/phosphomutase
VTNSLRKKIFKLKDRIPPKIKSFIANSLKSISHKNISGFKTWLTNIDWNYTTAYPVSIFTSYEGVVINERNRQPTGIVQSGKEKDKICEEIKIKLLNIKDPTTGLKVVDRVYKRNEIYYGRFTQQMPDLIFRYSSDYRRGNNAEGPIFTKVPPSEFDFQSGCHDENGIFIANGKYIKNKLELPDADIQDMAPTILYTLGLDIPETMDGKIMIDVFQESYLSKNIVHTISTSYKDVKIKNTLKKNDEEEMKKQLEGLGYL